MEMEDPTADPRLTQAVTAKARSVFDVKPKPRHNNPLPYPSIHRNGRFPRLSYGYLLVLITSSSRYYVGLHTCTVRVPPPGGRWPHYR